jgi:DNA modification methylase
LKELIKELELKNWRDFAELTKSLWVGDYRLKFLKHCGSRTFHGNYIPEIPYVMMLRYSKVGSRILDPMAGSGTTGDVGRLMERQ